MARLEGNIKGTNKATINSTKFLVKDSQYDDSKNSYFTKGESDLFTLTSANCAVQNKPLKFNFLIGGIGYFNLLSNYTLNSSIDCPYFNINFGFRFRNNDTITSDWKPFILDFQSASSRLRLTFTYVHATGNVILEIFLEDSVYNLGGTTTNINMGADKDFRFKLLAVYDSVQILKFKNSEELELVTDFSSAFSGETNVLIRGETTNPDAPGNVEIKTLEFLPVFDFKNVVNSPFVGAPLVTTMQGNSLNVTTRLTMPGTFNLALFPAWPDWILGVSEALTVEVLASSSASGQEQLLISSLEKLYTDAESVLACPIQGYQKRSNKGNLQIVNRCFNDGSLRNEDLMTLVVSKQSTFNNLSDRSTNPEFFFKEEGNLSGCNFDFQRIHHYQSFMKVTSDLNDHIQFMKSLELSSGDILYYGAVAPRTTDKDINIEITFNWSDEQVANPGLVIDEFGWSLEYEDGTVIDQEAGIHYSNYLTKLPDFAYNIPCPRARLIIYSQFGDGSSISARVLDDGKLIATGYAEVADLGVAYDANPLTNKERGVCIINFNINTDFGHIISYIHDICTNTIYKYQDSGTYMNIASKSLFAFEDAERNIVFIFLERNISEDFYDDRRKNLSYKKMNYKTGLAGTYDSSVYDIIIPSGLTVNSYIHAFDCVKKEDSLYIYLSTETNDLFVRESRFINGAKQSSKRNLPFTPFGNRGLISLGVDISSWDFEDKDYNIINYDQTNTVLTGLEEFSRIGQADIFFFAGEPQDAQFWRKYAHLTSIKANYDKDNDLTVISCIETNTRLPVVLMGNGLDFKEISLPSHFDIYKNTYGRGLPFKSLSVGEIFFYNSCIDSFSACLGYDGFVYTLASKRDLKEIGVVDPSFYISSEIELATVAITQNYRAKVFQPEYRFENLPFMSSGIYELSHQEWPVALVYPSHVDINRINQHLTAIITSSNLTKIPNIYTNSCIDEVPFETFKELAWTPELTDKQQNFNLINGTYTKDEYAQIQNLSASISAFNCVLTAANSIRNKHWKLDVGYKFHARLNLITSSTNFTEPAYFYASAITNVEDPFIRADARFILYGSYAVAEYYDYAFGDWVQLGEAFDLDNEVYDFYILMQRNGDSTSNKGSIAFVVKRFIHQDRLIAIPEQNYNFRNEKVFAKSKVNIQFEDNDSLEETEYGVFFVNNGVTNRNEYIRIYEIGFNLLKADIGSYIPFEDTKPDTSTFTNYQAEPRIGRRWRYFDDSCILKYDDRPNYPFKAYITSGKSKSSTYHWYNGFAFNLRGVTGFNLDEIYLERENIFDVNNILSKNLYGQFTTKDDNSPVVIWADANDSGLERFDTDMFIVTGVNFNTFTIVGKDDIADPWIDLETVSLKKYSANFTVETQDNIAKFYNSESNLPLGSLLSQEHYIYNPSYGHFRIKECNEKYIYAHVFSGSLFNSVYEIYGSRIAHQTSEVYSYRYMGIKINTINTCDNYFKIGGLDFGKATKMVIPHTLDLGFNKISNVNSKVEYVYSNQALNFEDSLDYNSYQLSYSVTSSKTYLTLLSAIDSVGNNNRPIWIIPDIKNDKFLVDLTFIDGQVSHETLVDELGANLEPKKYYKISLTLKGTPTR